jgi:hypothetical protein
MSALLYQTLLELNSPEISFLEIGTEQGLGFKAISILDKTTVDEDSSLDDDHPGAYKMSIPDFFADINNGKKYDLIYLNNKHDLEGLIEEYNLACDFLNENGIIVIHDLYPPTSLEASTELCSSGYNLLNYMLETQYACYVGLKDYGATIIFTPSKIDSSSVLNIDYETFVSNVQSGNYDWHLLTDEQWVSTLKDGIYQIVAAKNNIGGI